MQSIFSLLGVTHLPYVFGVQYTSQLCWNGWMWGNMLFSECNSLLNALSCSFKCLIDLICLGVSNQGRKQKFFLLCKLFETELCLFLGYMLVFVCIFVWYAMLLVFEILESEEPQLISSNWRHFVMHPSFPFTDLGREMMLKDFHPLAWLEEGEEAGPSYFYYMHKCFRRLHLKAIGASKTNGLWFLLALWKL